MSECNMSRPLWFPDYDCACCANVACVPSGRALGHCYVTIVMGGGGDLVIVVNWRCVRSWLASGRQRSVTGQELMQASDEPPCSAPAPQRSFIASTIISSVFLPARRAGHRSRGSLVVTVVVAVVALILAVLSMYVSVASSIDPALTGHPGPPPEPPSRLLTSKLVSPHFSNNKPSIPNMQLAPPPRSLFPRRTPSWLATMVSGTG